MPPKSREPRDWGVDLFFGFFDGLDAIEIIILVIRAIGHILFIVVRVVFHLLTCHF